MERKVCLSRLTIIITTATYHPDCLPVTSTSRSRCPQSPSRPGRGATQTLFELVFRVLLKRWTIKEKRFEINGPIVAQWLRNELAESWAEKQRRVKSGKALKRKAKGSPEEKKMKYARPPTPPSSARLLSADPVFWYIH